MTRIRWLTPNEASGRIDPGRPDQAKSSRRYIRQTGINRTMWRLILLHWPRGVPRPEISARLPAGIPMTSAARKPPRLPEPLSARTGMPTMIGPINTGGFNRPQDSPEPSASARVSAPTYSGTRCEKWMPRDAFLTAWGRCPGCGRCTPRISHKHDAENREADRIDGEGSPIPTSELAYPRDQDTGNRWATKLSNWVNAHHQGITCLQVLTVYQHGHDAGLGGDGKPGHQAEAQGKRIQHPDLHAAQKTRRKPSARSAPSGSGRR